MSNVRRHKQNCRPQPLRSSTRQPGLAAGCCGRPAAGCPIEGSLPANLHSGRRDLSRHGNSHRIRVYRLLSKPSARASCSRRTCCICHLRCIERLVYSRNYGSTALARRYSSASTNVGVHYARRRHAHRHSLVVQTMSYRRAMSSNRSIERTYQSPLRALWPAAHVER